MDTRPFERLIGAIYEDDFEQAAQILATCLSSISLSQRTTALVRSTSRGNLAITKALLEVGANPDGFLDQIPLVNATLAGNVGIVQLLVSAKATLDKPDENTYTALMYAVAAQKVEIVEILINAGANPDSQTYDNDTASKIAQKVGSQKILDILASR
jgi:ankyrin repeat protein